MISRVLAPTALVCLISLQYAGAGVQAPSGALESYAVNSDRRAVNPAHRFEITIRQTGVTISPEGGVGWRWAMALASWGRPGALHPAEQPALSRRQDRVDLVRGAMREWYVNSPAGLEQGFTIFDPPAEPGDALELDLTIAGTLLQSFAADGRAIDFHDGHGLSVLRHGALSVVDANGTELPSRFEARTGGWRIVVDDTSAVYPVTIDPLTTSPAWTGAGQNSIHNSDYGASVSTAGDVNGDGYSDVIVGAYNYSISPFDSDEGRAYVYLGSPSGVGTTAAWIATGDEFSSGLGYSVAAAGDVNGDGYADVIVGAPFHDGGGGPSADRGRAYVYLGSGAGLSTTPAWVVSGDQNSEQFGYAVASAGDVNGDTYADVLVGAPYHDGGGPPGTGRGRVFLYLGSSSGLATTPAWTGTGEETLALFGSSLGTAGDVNGDGYADVIVGAWATDAGGGLNADRGKAYVYLGRPTGLATTPVWTATGSQNGNYFGYSVSTAGDFNGDGYADVVVGAYGYDDTGGNDRGAFYIYLGSATGALSGSNPFSGPSSSAHGGFAVASVGDVNGDGFGDILVGAPGHDGGAPEGGAAALVSGVPAVQIQFTWNLIGNVVDGNLGYAVAAAGDVNGDGYGDVIVGAPSVDAGVTSNDPSRAYIYLGSVSNTFRGSQTLLTGDESLSYFAGTSASAGDVNGDGFGDVLVGATDHDGGGAAGADRGRAYLYLGSATGLAASPAWTVSGDEDLASLGISLAGAGDVNGDGYADVLIGASGHDAGGGTGAERGRVYLYLGSPGGLATTPAWTMSGTQNGDSLGYSVASAGDVNGDGFGDVIIAAPGSGVLNSTDQRGRVYVYLGSASGLATSPVWTGTGEEDNAYFGTGVASAGDVNGDGYSDIVVGSYGYDGAGNSSLDKGRAYVYLGSATGPKSTPAWTYSDPYTGQVGSTVTSAGDVNGDGYSDVAVAAATAQKVFVYLGSPTGLGTSAAWIQSTTQTPSGDHLGASLAAGDIDGDGYSDLLVGAPFRDHLPFPAHVGAVFGFRGSPTGLQTTSSLFFDGTQQEERIGTSVAAVDLDGDGRDDVVAGGPGHDGASPDLGIVYVSRDGGPPRFPQQTRTDGVTPIAPLGRSDAETAFQLSSRAVTPLGRGRVRLQWEVKPLGTPFNGAGLFTSSILETGAPGPMGSGVVFGGAFNAAEGTFYHWRMRVVSTNPLFLRSPWYALAGNTVTETKLRTGGCVDRDGDGFGALSDASCASLIPDCNDANNSIWDTPGETLNLRFTSQTALAWDAPSAPGTSAGLLYDTLRSITASNFTAATCVESDDGPNTSATDASTPAAGQAFFYLNRAQDSCPNGIGSLGTASSGTPRTGRACP